MFLNLKIINVTLFYKLKIIMGVLCLRKTKTYMKGKPGKIIHFM